MDRGNCLCTTEWGALGTTYHLNPKLPAAQGGPKGLLGQPNSVLAPGCLGRSLAGRCEGYGTGKDGDRFVAGGAVDGRKVEDRAAADAIRDVSTGREYSFLVNSFKPRCAHITFIHAA